MNVITKSTATVATLAASILLIACGGESESSESTGTNGVEAVVVTDIVTARGVPLEVTDDWFAQDAEGNVWYLGEDTAEYENGKPVNQRGSFEAGVDGAEAGIAMPADPEVGMAYRQEYYEGEAEDRAEVLSLSEKAEVPTGYYPKTLMTKDLVPLEPKVSEHKFYAEGVGLVLASAIPAGRAAKSSSPLRPGTESRSCPAPKESGRGAR